MELNGHHRKWPTAGRRMARLEHILILCATMSAFSVMVFIRVEVTRSTGQSPAQSWTNEETTTSMAVRQMPMPAMKTIVAYSPEAQAEIDRRFPIFCLHEDPDRPKNIKKAGAWQATGAQGLSVYEGYYDNRAPATPYARLLAVTNGTPFDDLPMFYCQTWRKNPDVELNEEMEVVEAKVTQIWWNKWDPGSKDTITPLLISCALTHQRSQPFLTSVTTTPCESVEEAVPIVPQQDTQFKRNFTVCVKDLYFDEDISERLVEWFELLILLGAEKFEVYVGSVTPKTKLVLKHYVDIGMASIRSAPRPRAESLWQRRRDHLIAYNDCLYRNLRLSRYVIPLDVDEIIVPRNASNWFGLLKDLRLLESESPGAASLAVSNAFFFDSFPTDDSDFMRVSNDINLELNTLSDSEVFVSEFNRKKLPHTLMHLKRSEFISPVPQYSKSFVSTSSALTVFNHYALSALGGASRARGISTEVALLHHYKASCRPDLIDCRRYTSKWTYDTRLLEMPISRKLIERINAVLDKI